MPMLLAWVSSKKVTIRSFQMKTRTAKETPEIITTCMASSSAMARILPSTMVWIDTDVGCNEAIRRPSANSVVKTRPIMASSRSLEYCLTTVSYTHLRAHETDSYLVCRLLLE